LIRLSHLATATEKTMLFEEKEVNLGIWFEISGVRIPPYRPVLLLKRIRQLLPLAVLRVCS